MQLILPPEIGQRVIEQLRVAGSREIGGLLMGEHVGPDTFRVLDLTVDQVGGSFARFLRSFRRHGRGLLDFFRRTGGQFQRFNYLGEWHSHPSFGLDPSSTDLATMRGIVDDPRVGANFAVLLIVRLSSHGILEARATHHLPSRSDALPVDLVLEGAA